jgi:hypothetical protein
MRGSARIFEAVSAMRTCPYCRFPVAFNFVRAFLAQEPAPAIDHLALETLARMAIAHGGFDQHCRC